MLWLYLHFPSLQLDTLFNSSESSSKEESHEQPIIIVDEKDHRVLQANQVALESGITLGMGLGSAAALCHHLHVHPYSIELEKNKLKEIAQWAYLVTSDMTLLPPNGLLIKASNMLSLYDGLDNYWHELKSHIEALNIKFSFATGYSPLSAILLGKQAINQVTNNVQQMKAWVNQQALSSSELPPKQVERLNRVGINIVEELLKLPLQEVARRFDIDLVNYVGRLNGQFKHPIDFYHPPESFQQYLELLFDIENILFIEKPLLKLLNQLECFLKLRDRVAFELTLTLHLRDKDDHHVSFYSAQGDYLAEKWANLTHLTLESLKLTAPVQGLTLSLARHGEPQTAYHDLFDGNTGTLAALDLLSLLQAKLGQACIQTPKIQQDPRPEKANRYSLPTLNKNVAKKQATVEVVGQTEPTINISQQRLRPSILLQEPEALTENVTLSQGPERIVSGWWDGEKIIRDYFIAHSENGRWLWVFRTPDKQWFLHGLFS
ncbi:UmuC domain-containing protein [Vibrio chagasii]|uniref:Y-family DNA polymerase n=1 Tax=Vibrio TaxID=662 RepID=UPI001493702E|nr:MULTISPECIES: DNA polymerase Y family protein [Vibrio]MCG9566492.1 DNA polymerase Y family protein [Vibrio chagasii]NOI38309.1 DNA polymerase Y family protein [Vibrio sp. 070316B]NOI85931.1 DNA polymerase Y family protein [Vibrio sp. 99K-1]CAH6841075.1 UmuC domain-containing protein [Vibrio chagasii]CAH6852941.1 UmuC domain-containing protein [Vibrio chagasii]